MSNTQAEYILTDFQASYTSWLENRTVKNPVLCTPLRFLYRDYILYAIDWGFSEIPADRFREILANDSSVKVRTRDFGLLRTTVSGIALKGI